MQARQGALHHGKARAGELDAHLKVQAQGFAQVHVVLDGEVHGFGCAPASHHHVAMLIRAARHAGVRQVGHQLQHGVQFGLDLLEARSRGFELGFDVGRLRHHRVDFRLARRAFGFDLSDLLAQGIALGLDFFGAGLNRFALRLQSGKGFNVQKLLGGFAGFESGNGLRQVFAQQIDIKHGLFQ